MARRHRVSQFEKQSVPYFPEYKSHARLRDHLGGATYISVRLIIIPANNYGTHKNTKIMYTIYNYVSDCFYADLPPVAYVLSVVNQYSTCNHLYVHALYNHALQLCTRIWFMKIYYYVFLCHSW